MSAEQSPAIPSLGNTFGAMFIGATIAAVLFGITNLQTLIYYKRFPEDWSLYRYSAGILWILDTAHLAFSTHALYYYLIDMYGNFPGALVGNVIWTMRLQLLLKVWIVVFVQWLYAIRLWKLGLHFHKILPWFVFLAVSASVGAGIFGSYDIYRPPNLSSISAINMSIYMFYSIIITADIIIAVMMCYYLHKSRAVTCFSNTADLLLVLMQLVLVSGVATSACSLFSIVTYIAWPDTLIFIAIDFILPKLYINSLLAMFNYRHQYSSDDSAINPVRNHIPSVLQSSPNSSEGTTKDADVCPRLLTEVQVTYSLGKSGCQGTIFESKIQIG